MGGKTGRMAYIDNIRLLVIILVVMQHLAVTFSGMGRWYYMEGMAIGAVQTSVFGFYESFMQAFFMGVLFLIAGYFTPGAYDKKGFGRFIKDRFIRLCIPAFIYMLVINPFIWYVQLDPYWISTKPAFFQFYASYLSGPVFEGSGPMWFTLALFIFTLVYALVRLIRGPVKDKTPVILPKISNMAALMIIIAAFAFLIRLVYPIGTSVMNMMLCYFGQYIVLFIVGLYSYRSNLFERISGRESRRWLFAAVVPGYGLWTAIMLLGGALQDYGNYNGGMTWQSAAYALWESFTAIAVSAGLLGLFREKYNYQSRLVDTMSKSSFTVYMFHAPIIIAISQLVKPLPLPAIAKFALLSAVCVPLCFAISHIIRKTPLLKRVL